MATVFTFHTGKAVMQIAAIEIAIDYLLDIGPPESVLPGEILIKDLEKGSWFRLPQRSPSLNRRTRSVPQHLKL